MEGTQFDFSYAPGITQEQILGFETAGEIWSQHLADNVTINIYVEMTDQLPENVIGGALTGVNKNVEYEKIWSEISKDLSTSDSLTAFNSDTSSEFSALINGQTVDQIESMKVTNANSKALNIIDGDRDQLDGYIVMSDLTGQSNVQWDYDILRDGETADNSLDFVSVAIHEIGHVMGFVSGVDDGDWFNVVTKANKKGKEIKSRDLKFVTPLDLFRYSDNGQMDLSMGTDAYFSIDGGKTNLVNFSTGEDRAMGGDGFQASHWKQSDNNALGIMDPALKVGQQREISSLDITAMDAIGWDVVNPDGLDWQEVYDNALDSADLASIADRSKDVKKMIKDSDTYQGRRSRSSSGSWQVGFWQNIKFQTLDVDVEVDNSHSEVDLAQVLFDDYMSQFDSSVAVQNKTGDGESETTAKNEFKVEKTVVQLIENSETVNSEASNLDLELLGRLLSKNLSEVLDANTQLAMPVG